MLEKFMGTVSDKVSDIMAKRLMEKGIESPHEKAARITADAQVKIANTASETQKSVAETAAVALKKAAHVRGRYAFFSAVGLGAATWGYLHFKEDSLKKIDDTLSKKSDGLEDLETIRSEIDLLSQTNLHIEDGCYEKGYADKTVQKDGLKDYVSRCKGNTLGYMQNLDRLKTLSSEHKQLQDKHLKLPVQTMRK